MPSQPWWDSDGPFLRILHEGGYYYPMWRWGTIHRFFLIVTEKGGLHQMTQPRITIFLMWWPRKVIHYQWTQCQMMQCKPMFCLSRWIFITKSKRSTLWSQPLTNAYLIYQYDIFGAIKNTEQIVQFIVVEHRMKGSLSHPQNGLHQTMLETPTLQRCWYLNHIWNTKWCGE